MKKKIKKLWVDALRSGEYEQGHGCLVYERNGKDYFCCLGVLCNVAIENGYEADWYGEEFIDGGGSSIVSLTEDLKEWAGIEPENAIDVTMHLMQMNDDEDASFDEIADWIEENL